MAISDLRFPVSDLETATFCLLLNQTPKPHNPQKHATKIVTPVGSCHFAIASVPLRAATQTRMAMRTKLKPNDIAKPEKQRIKRRRTVSPWISPRNSEIISVA
jgi:hypothetical protein